MHVGARERLRQKLARLVRQEAHRRLQALRQLHDARMAGTKARDHDLELVQIAQERRRTHERIEALRVPHVSGVHDHEAADQPVLARPLVVPRLRRENRRVDPVRNHANALRGRSLLDQPRSHGVADRDDPVGSPEVKPHEASKRADEKRVLEPLELDRDLREDVLAHDEQGHTKAPRDRQGHVADHRRIGHAEHEIRRRVGQARWASALLMNVA